VPFKLNQHHRGHIPKQQRKLMNWCAHDPSLRQRGSLTVWFTDEAIEGWRAEPRTTPGGQPCYSYLAILTGLTLRAVFRLALQLLVDSTGLKLCGLGEWLLEKHGAETRRSWRKLHIALDTDTGQIVAAALTVKRSTTVPRLAPCSVR